jgi:predicted permease
VLRRAGFITESFLEVSSRLVFSICLPVLLFTAIIRLDLSETFSLETVVFTLLATLVIFGLSWLSSLLIQPRVDRGVVTQGCFRSNLGVIGIALCANAYGERGLAIASLLMASLTVAFNVLSVFALSYYQSEQRPKAKQLVFDVLRNPLIVAIALASVIASASIPVPEVLLSAGGYLGSMALPLALLGTGAGLSLRALRQSGKATLLVVVMKTMLLPALVAGGALMAGFSGIELGVIFLLFVSPTATASYAMVRAMGGNDVLTANLISATTLVSIATCSIGLVLLKSFSLA